MSISSFYKFYIFFILIGSCHQSTTQFDLKNDFLLLHYDCKTDVDDLHSIAAAASLVRTKNFQKLNYHAVAGAYGIQKGLYVPGEPLFELAFGSRWSDAHKNQEKAIDEVFKLCQKTLEKGGKIWIADAGQSDFSADLIKKIIAHKPELDTKNRITVVQHSEWNESVTEPEKLAFVKAEANYLKIEDGNAINNGTPGFNTTEKIDWDNGLESKEVIEIWKLAFKLANQYNGNENRYLNKTISQNGFDFSDFSEVHHILELKEIDNVSDYFAFLKLGL